MVLWFGVPIFVIQQKGNVAQNKNYNIMTNKEVATTILNQLGASKFLAMTGSSNITIVEPSKRSGNRQGLAMKLVANKSKCRWLFIYLDSDDTYTMAFHKLNFDLKKEVEGLYFDQLQSTFTKITGMDTHL